MDKGVGEDVGRAEFAQHAGGGVAHFGEGDLDGGERVERGDLLLEGGEGGEDVSEQLLGRQGGDLAADLLVHAIDGFAERGEIDGFEDGEKILDSLFERTKERLHEGDGAISKGDEEGDDELGQAGGAGRGEQLAQGFAGPLARASEAREGEAFPDFCEGGLERGGGGAEATGGDVDLGKPGPAQHFGGGARCVDQTEVTIPVGDERAKQAAGFEAIDVGEELGAFRSGGPALHALFQGLVGSGPFGGKDLGSRA